MLETSSGAGGVVMGGGEGEPQHEHVNASDDVDVMMAESVSETQDGYRPNISSYAEPKMKEERPPPMIPLALETLSIFSGNHLSFFFALRWSRNEFAEGCVS